MDTDRAPRACTVSELESIQAFPSGSSHGIMGACDSAGSTKSFWTDIALRISLSSVLLGLPLWAIFLLFTVRNTRHCFIPSFAVFSCVLLIEPK